MPTPDRPILCPEHGASVPANEYDFKSAMCQLCAKKIATLYGINREDVSFVGTAKMNLSGYFQNMPGAGKLSEREKIRILLLRLGVNFDSTELEARGSEWLGGKK